MKLFIKDKNNKENEHLIRLTFLAIKSKHINMHMHTKSHIHTERSTHAYIHSRTQTRIQNVTHVGISSLYPSILRFDSSVSKNNLTLIQKY